VLGLRAPVQVETASLQIVSVLHQGSVAETASQ
jgi:hypothetical protein